MLETMGALLGRGAERTMSQATDDLDRDLAESMEDPEFRAVRTASEPRWSGATDTVCSRGCCRVTVDADGVELASVGPVGCDH